MAQDTLDVGQVSVPGQQQIFGKEFPLALQCRAPNVSLNDAAQWVTRHRQQLIEQVGEHGAIQFRGFPLRTPQDFDAFIAAFDLPNFPYYESLSNAVRINWTERVFSANEAPADVTIFFHHEMAQTPIFPAKLFFFCQQQAEAGGETPVCRSDALYERLTAECPEFARDCEEKGLRYTNVMPQENDPKSGMGRSWQSTLGAESKDEAEQRLASLGYTWQWQHDGSLKATSPVLPAVRRATSGRKVFFNQLIAAFQGWKDTRNDPSNAIRFGDGSVLDRDAVNVATRLAEELTFDIPWQTGDVVLVDNFLAMHARRTFQGTRKVLASLCEAHRHVPGQNDASPDTRDPAGQKPILAGSK